MQGFNKYYPPNYDPKEGSLNKRLGKHALGDRARKLDQGILIVRFELPFNIWCGHCNNHIGQGVRYNAEKKKVGNYYSTTIWSFRCKCHLCQHWFEIRTDPENTRYVVHEGARQKYEEWDPEENGQMVIDNAASTSSAPPDPFASLEKNVTQKTKALSESARLAAIHESNSTNWSDPYEKSLKLRETFRAKKRKILQSEDKAERVRDKFGLGERVSIESLRTPARVEDRDEEDKLWKEAVKLREAGDDERRRKRRREEEQVGWSAKSGLADGSAKGKERGLGSIPRSSSSRTIARLPARSSASSSSMPKSRSAPSSLSTVGSSSSSTKPSPALKALHDKLTLASALKNDPFAKIPSGAASSTGSPSSAATSILSGAVKLVRKSSR